MAYLLERRLVRYADVADIVTGMTRSVDLNGPAECDEAATTLWTILVVLQGREHLNTASETSENVLRWLFGRWSPCKCNISYISTPVVILTHGSQGP